MLVSALMGRQVMQKAYAHAIKRGYRFYSYGDSNLLLPKQYSSVPDEDSRSLLPDLLDRRTDDSRGPSACPALEPDHLPFSSRRCFANRS
jgi:hypothetical protein